MMNYLYVFLTIIFTVYGQLIIKWQVLKSSGLPITKTGKIFYLFHLLLNPWILSGFLAAFLASLTWISAMTKLELSEAYPFMSLTFVFVLILSSIFFHETITMPKLIGLGLIVSGVIIGAQL